jgi:predicted dehydrogenase
VPDSASYDNGFKAEWEMFIRHLFEGAPFKWTLLEGAKGVQLAEAGLKSWKERRWVDIPPLDV